MPFSLTIDDLVKNHDKGLQIDVIIQDFVKALDTLQHDNFLLKLENYRIRGSFLKGHVSSFVNATRVVVEWDYSKETPVISGLLQGTVIGPLFFLVHINDLPETVKSQYAYSQMNAYYIVLSAPLQQDLNKLEEWSTKFNIKKWCPIDKP